MTTRFIYGLFCAVMCCTLECLQLVSAQGVADQSSGVATLQEVVVTAEKHRERLQDVPIAVSAVGADTLQKMGADSIEDYARDVPSLDFSSLGPGGRVRLSIRGINPNSGAASVGFYVDDTPIPQNVGFVNLINIDPRLPDVNRIEVLRGPQGTLYGSGSMAGLVKVVTNAPDPTAFHGNLAATASVTERGGVNSDFEGVANVPLMDELAVRVTAYHRYDEGFISRIYGPNAGSMFVANQLIAQQPNSANVTTNGGRVVLGFFPESHFHVSLSAYAEKTQMNGYAGIDGGPTNPTYGLVFSQPLNVAEPYTSTFQLYSLNLDWNITDNLNLTSSTSHFKRLFDLVEDGTEQLQQTLGGSPIAAPIEEITNVTAFTQEVRLSTARPVLGLTYLLGLFYQDTNGVRGSNWIVPGTTVAFPSLPIPNDNLFTETDLTTNIERAVFGQVSYNFLKSLDLTLGFRRFQLGNSQISTTDGFFVSETIPTTGPLLSASNEKTNFSAAIRWKPNQDDVFYARAAQGLRPGAGLSPLPTLCNNDLIAAGYDPSHLPSQVNPDSVWDYEVGGKTVWANHRLAINSTLYWINWTNVQQSLLLACGFEITQNAGRAISRGAELEVVADPLPGVELALGGSFDDAFLNANAPTLGGAIGDRIQEVPRLQGGGSITYRFPVQLAGVTAYLRGDGQYVGNSWLNFNKSNPTYNYRPAYALFNIRAGLDSDKWSCALFVDNLLDKRADLAHPDSLTFNIPDRPRIVVSSPRTVGVTLRRVF
jgi:iron complex outermembrane recepter protein